MCRFCLEGALVRGLEELDDRQLLDAFGPPIEVLEEIDDLRLAFTNLDSGKHAIEVVMARVVEHYVLYGFDASIFESVQRAYGHETIAAFLEASRNAQPDSLGAALADITIYQQHKAWSRLIAERASLVSDANDRLYDYLDSWCDVWLWPAAGGRRRIDGTAHRARARARKQRRECRQPACPLHRRFCSVGYPAPVPTGCRRDSVDRGGAVDAPTRLFDIGSLAAASRAQARRPIPWRADPAADVGICGRGDGARLG